MTSQWVEVYCCVCGRLVLVDRADWDYDAEQLALGPARQDMAHAHEE